MNQFKIFVKNKNRTNAYIQNIGAEFWEKEKLSKVTTILNKVKHSLIEYLKPLRLIGQSYYVSTKFVVSFEFNPLTKKYDNNTKLIISVTVKDITPKQFDFTVLTDSLNNQAVSFFVNTYKSYDVNAQIKLLDDCKTFIEEEATTLINEKCDKNISALLTVTDYNRGNFEIKFGLTSNINNIGDKNGN